MSDWIKTEEKLPEHGQMVLAYEPDAVFDTKKIRHITYAGYSEPYGWFIDHITHWKPAIKPPKS